MATTSERGATDLEAYVREAIDEAQARMWTSSPGIIKSVDRAKQTATIQLSVKGMQRDKDGKVKRVSLPLLQDVPLQFPGGGGMAMTFPVKPGDECLVVFSSRSPDSWQQSGGEQAPVDAGMHSLSNGFALMGFRSNPEAAKIAGGSDPDAVTLRSEDGQTMISLKGGEMKQKVGGVELKLTSAGIDITGGYIKHNGKRIDDQHRHDEVVSGGDLTGLPQP